MFQNFARSRNSPFKLLWLLLTLSLAGCSDGTNSSSRTNESFDISPLHAIYGAGQFYQFSTNSQYLYSPAGTFDIPDEKLLKRVEQNDDFVLRIATSPDGIHFATGARSGMLRLYSSPDWKEGQVIEAHSDAIIGLSFVDDGRFLLSASMDGSVKKWDFVTDREMQENDSGTSIEPQSQLVFNDIVATSRSFFGMVLNQDLSLMALAYNGGGNIDIRRTDDLSLVNQFESAEDFGSIATFSSDGKYLLTLAGPSVRILRLSDNDCTETLTTMVGSGASSAAFSPDGKILALGYSNRSNQNGIVELIKWEDRSRLGAFVCHRSYFFTLQFSPDGKFLATSGRLRGAGDIDVHLWKTNSMQDSLFKGLPPKH